MFDFMDFPSFVLGDVDARCGSVSSVLIFLVLMRVKVQVSVCVCWFSLEKSVVINPCFHCLVSVAIGL